MTKPTDAVNYPYDFVDPQAEYWATHGRKDEDPFASRFADVQDAAEAYRNAASKEFGGFARFQ